MVADERIVARGEKCLTCGRYYDRHVVVEGLIVADGKILLALRDSFPDKGKWAMPGGFLDWDETGEEAVLREIREEIGAAGKVTGLFGVYTDKDAYNFQNVALVYTVTVTTNHFSPQVGEVAAVTWFNLDALPEKIAFNHREVIEEYKQKYEVR